MSTIGTLAPYVPITYDHYIPLVILNILNNFLQTQFQWILRLFKKTLLQLDSHNPLWLQYLYSYLAPLDSEASTLA
jgi:hypothetical protein